MSKRCLSLFVLAVACLAHACSFETRSTAYECPTGDECEGSRTCVDGWCVATTGGGSDSPDAFECPSVCDRCRNGECRFDCEEDGSCSATIVCPAGVPCRVECDGVGSCGGGIDCSLSSSCNVDCDGTASCGDLVECGAGPCDLTCDGLASCAGGLDCASSCQCESSCPDGACDNHQCPGNSACTQPYGCSDSTGSCRNCN